jgi:hypothetical protein
MATNYTGDAVPTKTLIQERIQDVNDVLASALTGLATFVTNLSNIIGSTHLPYVTPQQNAFVPATIKVDPGETPKMSPLDHTGYHPERGSVNTSMAPLSPQATIDGLVTQLETTTDRGIIVDPARIDPPTTIPPDFTTEPTPPIPPTTPVPFTEEPPVKPELDPVVPDKVTDPVLPPLPIFPPPQWPERIPINTTITFTGIPPQPLTDKSQYIVPYSYNDPAENYTSALLNAVRAKLLHDATYGGTGLGATIENDIWNRSLERDELALFEAIQNTMDTWGASNFPLPNGVLVSDIDELNEKHYDNLIDRSRDVAIKQAELADANTKFAVTSGVQVEQMWIAHQDNIAARALESARNTVEMAVAIFKAHVDYYNSQLDLYKAEAEVYKTKISAEMLKVEIYRNELETVKTQVEINKADVELYNAQIAGIEAQIKVYNIRLEQNKLQLGINQLRSEVFRTQIEAFTALVKNKEAEYGLYKAEWEGEIAKIQLFSEQVKAYAAQVEATKIKADIAIADMQAAIETNKYNLETMKVRLQKYEADVRAASAKIDSLVKEYEADSRNFGLFISASEADNRLDLEKARVTSQVSTSINDAVTRKYEADARVYADIIQEAKADAEVEMERAKIIEQTNNANIQVALQAAIQNLQSFVSLVNIDVEAAKGGAQYYAQLAAAAMQAIHATMQIGASFGVSDTTHVGYGYSGTYPTTTTLPNPMQTSP